MDGSYTAYLLQTIAALVVVCAVAWLVLRYGMRRLVEPSAAKGRRIRLVERAPVDARRSLLLVEVGSRWLLIGSTENSLSLLAEIDPSSVPSEPEATPRSRFQEVLERFRRTER